MDTPQEDVDQDVNLSQTWTRFVALLELVRDRFHLREKLGRLQDYAVEHPAQALIIAMVFSLCSIPLIAFIIFSCVTVVITFIGFLFFEGFLLLFGAIALSGALFVFALIAVFLSFIILGVVSTYSGGRNAYLYLQDQTFTVRLQQMYLYCMGRAELFTNTPQVHSPDGRGPSNTTRGHSD